MESDCGIEKGVVTGVRVSGAGNCEIGLVPAPRAGDCEIGLLTWDCNEPDAGEHADVGAGASGAVCTGRSTSVSSSRSISTTEDSLLRRSCSTEVEAIVADVVAKKSVTRLSFFLAGK